MNLLAAAQLEFQTANEYFLLPRHSFPNNILRKLWPFDRVHSDAELDFLLLCYFL